MRLRSLEARLVILSLALILAVQLASFVAIRFAIQQNVGVSIRGELANGERVFRRLLDQHAQTLAQRANLLATDSGFKAAVGSGDIETIVSMLDSRAKRSDATQAMLVGIDRRIEASTLAFAENPDKSILRLLDRAEQDGRAGGIDIIGNHPYQIAVVPIKTSTSTSAGWIALMSPLDLRIVKDMRTLSSLQVSILADDRNGQWRTDASTLPETEAAALSRALRGAPEAAVFLPQLTVAGNDYSAQLIDLSQQGGQRIVTVLQRSTSAAAAPYGRLQLALLLLTVLGMALAAAGSLFTAKRITGPLRQLGEAARRFGAGDYQGRIDILRNDEIGELSAAFAGMRDGISNREAEIRRLAYWDALTGLPNRAQFAALLNEAIADARSHQAACYVLMMDLDRFKNVNDVMGHSFGDALLRLVAERLRQQVTGPANKIARLGGDEFAILMPRTHIADARNMAARILKSLEQPILLEDRTVDLGAGIGIAGVPEHGLDAESLLSRVEVAMYAAKTGGNEAVVYDPAIDKSSRQNLSLLSELRSAIEKNEFRLFVQPKVMLGTGEVVGLEALVRWAHPEKGMVFPDHFIPFAEQTGFIRIITQWMLEQAAALCSDLAVRGTPLRISVNLSTRDLLDQELPLKLSRILDRHGIAPALFCLEITESAIMDDPLRAQQTLEGLHSLGVDLSIDDFGTGYSSLAYLKRLAVQELKIDKSFVLKMERNAEDAKIVRSTIDLGHNLGLKVVAEGVENAAVWEMLAVMGCDQGQGYFMSKPMPAAQLPVWLGKWAAPAIGAAQDRRMSVA